MDPAPEWTGSPPPGRPNGSCAEPSRLHLEPLHALDDVRDPHIREQFVYNGEFRILAHKRQKSAQSPESARPNDQVNLPTDTKILVQQPGVHFHGRLNVLPNIIAYKHVHSP